MGETRNVPAKPKPAAKAGRTALKRRGGRTGLILAAFVAASALMLLSGIRPEDVDGAEALSETLEVFCALAEEYRALAGDDAVLADAAARLGAAANMAMDSLKA